MKIVDLEKGEVACQILNQGFKEAINLSGYSYQELLVILSDCSRNSMFSKNQRAVFLKALEKELYKQQFSAQKIGILSDTHIGNVEENREYIQRTYEEFYNQGIFLVFHLGDLLDGYGIFRNLSYKQKLEIFQIQLQKFKKEYPTGFQNYVTYGNHDEQFLECKIDLIKKIPKLRSDFFSLGFGSNYILWNLLKINLTHYINNYTGKIVSNWDFQLRGHSHHYAKKENNIYVPTCSDNHPVKDLPCKEPGFLILEDEEKNVLVDCYVFCDNKPIFLKRELIPKKSA